MLNPGVFSFKIWHLLVLLLQVRCFTPPSQADCLCPQPQTAACPSGGSWPQWGRCIWPGRPAWTAAPRAGCLMAASATRWRGLALNVEGACWASAPSHLTLLLTTPQSCTMLTAIEVWYNKRKTNKNHQYMILLPSPFLSKSSCCCGSVECY